MSIERLGLGENVREDEGEVRRSIFEALRGEKKDLSNWPKYLYDARGSELFEKITEQPEYYQTGTELSILENVSEQLLREDTIQLVELGSGSSSKTRAILEAMISQHGSENVEYLPLDVSESAIEEGSSRLERDYPGIGISGYVGDFDGAVEEFLRSLPDRGGSRLVIFLGGTIGNFTPQRRLSFLEGVGSGLRSGDRFLVGVDLVKDVTILEAAYHDPAGVTAEFNRNILNSINNTIGSDFNPSLFEHRAIYNESKARIEMWLVSIRYQEVDLGGNGLSVSFREGEGVRTEISAKFTRQSAANMFEGSGMRLLYLYTDDRQLFGLALGEPE